MNKLTPLDKKIIECAANTEKQIGFIARQTLITPFPYKDPGDVNTWVRNINNYTFVATPLIYFKDNKTINIGIPFGATSRVILVYIITEAKKKKSKEIVLGKSFREFIKNIGYKVSGGKRGTFNKVKDQLKRILTCRCSWIYDSKMSNNNKEEEILYTKNITITSSGYLWTGTFEDGRHELGTIKLTDEFYEIITKDSIPIDYNIVKTIKHSCLALDTYFWLNYIKFYNNKKRIIPYHLLHQQFAPDGNIKNFKTLFHNALRLIRSAGFEFNIIESKTSLILYPSPQRIIDNTK